MGSDVVLASHTVGSSFMRATLTRLHITKTAHSPFSLNFDHFPTLAASYLVLEDAALESNVRARHLKGCQSCDFIGFLLDQSLTS